MIVFWMCAFLSVGIPHSQAATPECEEVDISLVIDRTMSVGEENYDTMLDAVKDLISEYDVSADKTLFSIMTFAGNATLRASLGDKKYQSNEALMQLLDEMKQNDELGMPTRIDNALKMVGDEVFVAKNGDRPEAPNIMIIFTDGTTHKDSEPYDTVLPALEDKGVQRIAVGIGEKRLDPDELAVIAGNKDRVLLAKDFNDLKNQLADITEAICNIDGGYTKWSKWSACSVTCGGGVRRRSRTCTNPAPKNDGKTCIEQNLGPPKQTQKCNAQDCPVPGGYTQWSNWGKCSKTCGGGVQRSSRTCTNPPPSGGGPSCTEQKLGAATKTRKCNTQKCAVPGGYTQWSKWGWCSKTCGGGVQRRSRTCTNPPPSGGGPTCTEQKLGPPKQTRKCNTKKCAVPGGYTQWSKWGKCSKTCGGGVQRRSRTCTNPRPSGGGPSCTKQKLGPAKQTRKCNTKKCPVPGGYTQWSSWGKCSVTCGGGVQRSSRTCTNPPPSGGGPSCTKQKLGPASKTRKCNTQDCGVDGGWSAWSNPPCDKTCGGGKRVRRRTCTNPPPSGDGAACSGSSTKTESCNKQACPTPVPPPPKPCIEHLDVGVIIDSSNSITNNDYNTVRQFIIALARRLQISEAGTHMAILLYSYEAHTWHKFTEAQTIAAITSKANALPHLQGGTRTDRALELATADFFGWDDCGDRPDKPNVLLVLTDGDTNKGSKPFNQVTPPLDDASVRRIAIGIGNKVDYSELRQIASSNDDVLRVSGYEYLVDKLEAIMKLSCEEQVLGKCGNWASYGSCSKSCGGGTQVRTRSCPLNSLHSKKQKKHCNDNLCPGQQSCEDKLSDCPLKAAKGDCWKTAKPPILGAGGVIKYSANRNYPMWDSCKKSCQRCDVDQSCFDEDPYNCPTQIGYLSCRSLFGIAHCKKTCNRCGGWGRR